ncbi:hypothetical protein F6B93_03450 [Mycobacterium spongiae]|uniref:Transposase n=1 Tax=Mycobacterium spongiae TaxID=886343 RepID=A0A975K1C8_9MYCO|nr:hypothetical protein F6B93_03450 [Mycobacterium spongiae]
MKHEAQSVAAQHDQIDRRTCRHATEGAAHLEDACSGLLAFTTFPQQVWRQIWSNNPQQTGLIGPLLRPRPPQEIMRCPNAPTEHEVSPAARTA